jgi:uncharacterized protein YjbJ (UPF0337 family)
MVNEQMLQGRWNEIKGKIKEHWGLLTDDDLQAFQGNLDQLVGTIQRKTGETRETIEEYLNQVTSEGPSVMGRAGETARQYAEQATSTIQDASRQAMEGMRQGYSQAGRMVQQNPGQSVAIAAGAGLFVGVLLGLMMRPR